MMMSSSSSEKVFLFATGCFNPPTIMHLRMFDMAFDHLLSIGPGSFQVLGGIVSLGSDNEMEESNHGDNLNDCHLVPMGHRITMLRLAVKDEETIRISPWESEKCTERTMSIRAVLDHHREVLTDFASGLGPRPTWISNHLTRRDVSSSKILLLCNEGFLESLNNKGKWNQDDVLTIVRDHGLLVVSADPFRAMRVVDQSDILYQFRSNIIFAMSDMGSDITSAKIRLAIKRNRSIRHLVPESVIQYIKENNLYQTINYSSFNSRFPYADIQYIDDSISMSSSYLLSRVARSSVHNSPAKSTQCEESVIDNSPLNLNNSTSGSRRLSRSESLESVASTRQKACRKAELNGFDETLASTVTDSDAGRFSTIRRGHHHHRGHQHQSQNQNNTSESGKKTRRIKKTGSEASLPFTLATKGVKITSDKESFL